MKYNICWECGNACAHKCEYVRSGHAIDGWTAKECKGGYLIDKCPNFVTDGYIGLKNIAKILGLTENSILAYLGRGQMHKVVDRAKEMGYNYSYYKSKDAPPIHLLVPINEQRGLDSNDNLQWQCTLL